MSAITPEQIAQLRTDFAADAQAKVAQNAVTTTDVLQVALNREIVANTDFTYSTKLDDWKVTNQKSSGRCWLFAMLNLFRVGAMKEMGIKDFEFSQAHIHFWDKFERANHFLHAIIETAEKPIDDRTVAFLLSGPIDDGGQWNMAVNLVTKYGLVPKSAYPESRSSSATMRMNRTLLHLLRASAAELRGLAENGASRAELDLHKSRRMEDVWRVLCIHLGTPPETFDWQWRDKDKKFHREGEMTPQDFVKKFVKEDVEDFICLVHDPRNPTMQTYTVDWLQNVVDGPPVLYLNIGIEEMKEITRAMLEDGMPVWMGCDVGKQMHRKNGLWDANLFEFEELYGVEFGLDKAERLRHHQTLMTHAMLFTGVDVVDGKTRRWRVENSWGDEGGRKGFYTMNDNWFDEYMFEIAAPSKYLTDQMKAALDTEPIVLPPWDPMGSLA
ncbi:MAG: aminopeptidase [Euryarchaeota archaeon]|nr:aminopeptidase [Euryarchaeota archaeon]MED5486161.1 C1 family peptidase [Candidatus Thermoplasmatota archaeon]